MNLQRLIDSLSQELGRSLAIDSVDLSSLLVASAQIGPLDEVRRDVILNRRLSENVSAWARSLQLERSTRPARVPANPEFEMLARICFPLRHGGEPIALLWIIDEPPLTESETDTILRSLPALVDALVSSGLLANVSSAAVMQVARDLLVNARASALKEAVNSGYLSAHGRLWAVSIQVEPATDGAVSGSERLLPLLSSLRLGGVFQSSVGAPGVDELFLAVRQVDPPFSSQRDFDRCAAISQRTGVTLVAIGVSALDVDDLCEGLNRARFAAGIHRVTARTSEAHWEHLGAWALLYGRALDAESLHMLSPAVAAVVADPREYLWQTWLAYLDSSRDVARTCEALHIRRATLYYRLNAVKAVTGHDAFDDGWQMTAAHVALRGWRLAQRLKKP